MLQSFITIFPLLILILIGFVAGKIYKLSTVQYGYMVAFILAPLVSFGAILQLDFKLEYIFLPFVVAVLCSIISISSFKISRLFLSGTLPNLVGMAASAGNTGFFGIPIFLLFFPASMLGVYLLANLGMQIAEVSVGYYIASRGNATIQESLRKLLKMPPLWAAFIAIILNIFNFNMPDIMHVYWEKMLGAWLIFGMMMIGIALASCQNLRPDIKFCTVMMSVRFIMWPLLTIAIVLADIYVFRLLNSNIYFILAVFALVPLPGNSVALSATLGLHPDKMAFAVVLSTLIAAIMTPLLIGKIYSILI